MPSFWYNKRKGNDPGWVIGMPDPSAIGVFGCPGINPNRIVRKWKRRLRNHRDVRTIFRGEPCTDLIAVLRYNNLCGGARGEEERSKKYPISHSTKSVGFVAP